LSRLTLELSRAELRAAQRGELRR